MNNIISQSVIFSLLLILTSCLSMNVPKEYVPDKEIVYLRQKTEFKPIKYDIEKTDPYKWEYSVNIDKINPDILKNIDFNYYKKPDFNNDVKVYKEVKEHLLYMTTNEKYIEMKKMLDSYVFKQPEQRNIVKGDKIKDFSNSEEFVYPEIPDAKIYYYNNGDIEIEFSNGGRYNQKNDGTYFEFDSKGNEMFAVFPKTNSYRYKENNISYAKQEDYISIEYDGFNISHFYAQDPQYVFKNINSLYKYVFFTDNNKTDQYKDCALIFTNNLRLDYIYEHDLVMIGLINEALVIENDYKKNLYSLINKTFKTGDLLSIYFPEGIKIDNLTKPLTYSTVSPNWPEKYIPKQIGQFTYYFTDKDKNIISKINPAKNNDIFNFVKKNTEIDFAAGRAIIIPPDLESYRKLFVSNSSGQMNWYPSGFEGNDVIIMWPLSVKVYDMPSGDDYFWNEELNSILVHELTHLAVGEITGIYSPVPVWLNEGLAVYTESEWSPDSKKYWTITFDASYKMKKLMDWDDVTKNSTSDYQITRARVQYAQSFRMVQYLITTFGKNKVVEYIKSFKADFKDIKDVVLIAIYKEKFKKVFNTGWDDNLKSFDEYVRKNMIE